jgi:hypothetical protein
MCIRISASASWSAFRRLSNPLSFAARTRNRKATFYPCPSWPNTPDEELPRVGDRTDAHRDCVRRHLRLCRCRGDGWRQCSISSSCGCWREKDWQRHRGLHRWHSPRSLQLTKPRSGSRLRKNESRSRHCGSLSMRPITNTPDLTRTLTVKRRFNTRSRKAALGG